MHVIFEFRCVNVDAIGWVSEEDVDVRGVGAGGGKVGWVKVSSGVWVIGGVVGSSHGGGGGGGGVGGGGSDGGGGGEIHDVERFFVALRDGGKYEAGFWFDVWMRGN